MAVIPPQLIGTSPAFLATMDHVSRSAALDQPVLLAGERGTGKALMAARLHFLSPRWENTFEALNCAAVTEAALAGSLFGENRAGLLETAGGGTLFLGAIDAAPLWVQHALLEVLEHGEFTPLDGDEAIQTDVRIIAATDADLPAAVSRGAFSPDLLDRLSADVITLPPLRARRSDIAPLSESFGRRMAAQLGAESFPGFSPQVMALLQSRDWPGNIRALKAVCEGGVLASILDDNSFDSPISSLPLTPFETPWTRDAPAISEPTSEPPPGPDIAATNFYTQVNAYELSLLTDALARSSNHQGKAAEALGLTYHSFRGLLRKHGLKK